MERFVTLDLNGWLDHLVVGGESDPTPEARALGFRSCLFRLKDTWLFGSQALAAARDVRSEAPLPDAIDALALAAGHGNASDEEREALPRALWQLVKDFAVRSNDPAHLAVIVPDGRSLGCLGVDKSGRTRLESLHDRLRQQRPADLSQSRLELIWRSVAALRAAMDRSSEHFADKSGSVLVISINRRTFWTVLDLRAWSSGRGQRRPESVHIVRRPVMDDCDPDEAWTRQRLDVVRSALKEELSGDFDALNKWTRSAEMLATGMSPQSLARLGVEADALEHWSWPTPGGGWGCCNNRPAIERFPAALPSRLKSRLKQFVDSPDPLAIVIESPASVEMTSAFERLVRECAVSLPIIRVTGHSTAEAAVRLAYALGRDSDVPAWLDAVPAIELETRNEDGAEWRPIIARDQAIPAGQTYHTPPDARRKVTLAPGIEHIHLHLRRGDEGNWNKRYTEYAIPPSDHQRFVEPRARVRPLSGEARVEMVEHRPDGAVELLAASRSSVRWSEMNTNRPPALGSIPELYVFRASEQGWQALEPLLQQVASAGVGSVERKLKNTIYKTIRSQWKDQVFPLGSDGLPPAVSDPNVNYQRGKLLTDATSVLQTELEQAVNDVAALKPGIANRLHMPLTWLFTGCPERTVRVLSRALLEPHGAGGRTLHVDNDYSAWSIYSGIGRAVRSDDDLRTIFDKLIGNWETAGGQRQDKFLLAAVTHPLARRVSARRVLAESEERFDRVRRFLDRQLRNLLGGYSDRRPDGGSNRSLELRYITMGYRGLCQLRYGAYPDWFPADGEEARAVYDQLREASKFGGNFERELVDLTAPYLIGEGEDPTMPGGF
ncbi:MAG: hypothetical protein OXH52_12365 [Gammaproteobacteria bacterium]|nr:hypothetical protein [Gammaproteobacteria bacterium]